MFRSLGKLYAYGLSAYINKTIMISFSLVGKKYFVFKGSRKAPSGWVNERKQKMTWSCLQRRSSEKLYLNFAQRKIPFLAEIAALGL